MFKTSIKYLGHRGKRRRAVDFRNDASEKVSLESFTTSYIPEIALFEIRILFLLSLINVSRGKWARQENPFN